jgi:hypothetical protein
MTNYVDLDDLRKRRFFESATFDPRFVWEETEPLVSDGKSWRRFRIVDCAHRPVDRDGDLCTHCGHAFEHSPHTEWATAGAKKAAARRRKTK